MADYDVIIIGAGAAGMMCAVEAGKRGRKVLLLDHADAPGEKIRISGGGRCNFTNLHATPANFLSANPHFCKSALSRFTQHDFIKMVQKHRISYHEKTLGQLFCDGSSKEIIGMLLDEMEDAGVDLRLEVSVTSIAKNEVFNLETTAGPVSGQSLVIATGGLSIPKMGATGFAYDVARQFGIGVTETRAGLVPLTFDAELLSITKELSGLSVDPAEVSCGKTTFREALLFTHRGLSGPAVLQISSYWEEGREISVNLLPDKNMFDELKSLRQSSPRILLHTAVSQYLPKRLAEVISSGLDMPLADISDAKFKTVAEKIHSWRIVPVGTEGYRTAEVTLGGIDTNELSSKTLEAKKATGLYFIGEAVDVTGHLGGFNFQWAWASGWCAGQFV